VLGRNDLVLHADGLHTSRYHDHYTFQGIPHPP